MTEIEVYTKDYCGYSARAKLLLAAKGVAFTEIDVTHDRKREAEMIARAGGRTTVPQIFIGPRHIGGFDDLAALDASGSLDPLLDDVEEVSPESQLSAA